VFIILVGNVETSPEYDAMLRGIAWTVDLNSHTYSAGLDATSTEDGRAFYYANSTHELILHSTPHLAHPEPADTHFIKRKRHIGNDHVQVIWSEGERDYRDGAIGGEFSSIQMVVHVEKHGYSINILQDQRVEGRFGPLIEGILVKSMNILNPALRTSIMAANRLASRPASSSQTITPMQHRLSNIETIVDRHSLHDSTEWDGIVSAMVYPEQSQKVVAQ
jgi:Ral GTPase-activating protein subunit alpha